MVLLHSLSARPLVLWYRAVDDFGNVVEVNELPWKSGELSPLSRALAFIDSAEPGQEG